MDFNKVINNMQELQQKVKIYEQRNKLINDAIESIKKDIMKLNKKIDNEKNELDKHILEIKVLIMKEVVKKFNLIGENIE